MKKTAAKKIVAIEISQSDIVLLAIDRDAGSQTVPTAKRITWREEGTSLQSDAAATELAHALSSLISKERLSGCDAHIALSSDFCVTRVVAGDADDVRRELRRLQDRAAWYLSLGTGKKIAAQSVRAIDTKQHHAWVTVINRETLQAVERAANEAGLNVVQVEHSLTALAHAVGATGRDADEPVLIVEINHRGVELGISYQGRLLLDYRPGGGDAALENTAEIVRRHLKRLQRYCDRHFPFKPGKLRQVLLCGHLTEAHEVQQQFEGLELAAEILEARSIRPEWTDRDVVSHGATFAAPIGLALATMDAQAAKESPNLMEEFHKGMRGPLLSPLIKLVWPAAAMIFVTLGMTVASWLQESKCASIDEQLKKLEPRQARLTMLKGEMMSSNQKLTELNKIKSHLSNPDWSQFIRTVGSCMPEHVWLESLKVERDGTVTIVGPSHTEDAIYEFVGYLKSVPYLRDVMLEGTQPIHLEQGPATRFDVKCKLVDFSDGAAGATNK